MHTWELQNEKRNGGVLCIDNYDITADGVLDLIIGRDDGLVEVYSYDDSDEPVHRHTHVSITELSDDCKDVPLELSVRSFTGQRYIYSTNLVITFVVVK